MNIYAYAVCWNEEQFLPHYLRHYQDFCDRIFLLDNGSTDRTLAIAKSHPLVTVMPFETGGTLRDDVHIELKNRVWKPHKETGELDWAIVSDLDELFYHPNPREFFASCRRLGVAVPEPQGFQMFAESFPDVPADRRLWEVLRRGAPSSWYSKCVAFDVRDTAEINYGPGCHECFPYTMGAKVSMPEAKLLHFKYVHDLDTLRARHERYRRRLSAQNLEKGWGFQYTDFSHQEQEREAVRAAAALVL